MSLSKTRALVVADGEVDRDALRTWIAATDEPLLVVAADGGARHLAAIGRFPDLICGDGDSLGDELDAFARAGTRIELHPVDKDESDLELALRAVIAADASAIDVFGALAGARAEHGLANELLLGAAWLDGICVIAHHRASRLRRIGTRTGPGSVSLDGSSGDFVSLLPLDDPVEGIVTDGLRFPLRGEALPLGSTRGLSNELTAQPASVQSARGRLIVIETPRSPHGAVS